MSAPEETEDERQTRLHSELWHACAGVRVKIPALGSRVFYFPQGHVEHASEDVDFRSCLRLPPPKVLCSVAAVNLCADPHTDNVFARITLDPCADGIIDSGISVNSPGAQSDPPKIFKKMLTASDFMKGSSITIPVKCAETIFPTLDPVTNRQKINLSDIHGNSWKITHAYSAKQHTLTTGWRGFFDNKKLLAGDTLVFMWAAVDDIRLGILRQRPPNFAVRRRLRAEDVLEAIRLAAEGKRFEVVYYPRDGGADFCVGESLVSAAMGVLWPPGSKVRMEFLMDERENVSSFMGTIVSVEVKDPVWWPLSPWRCLRVRRNSCDPQLQDLGSLSPWLAELVKDSDHPSKKLKSGLMDQHLQQDVSNNQSLNPDEAFRSLFQDNAPASMQGAMHTQYSSSPSNLDNTKLLPAGFKPPEDNISHPQVSEKSNSVEGTPEMVYVGETIQTEKQMSKTCSSSPSDCKAGSNRDGSGLGSRLDNDTHSGTEPGLETRRCDVFMGSGNTSLSLDVSSLGSYAELYNNLASLFGIEVSTIPDRVVYQDDAGKLASVEDEPFSHFVRKVRLLWITD